MAETPASDRPEVGVLLLNYRQPTLTRVCLDDLAKVVDLSLRVSVIDNGSGDDSAALLSDAVAAFDAPPHRAELLALHENLGFGGGMNRGIEWAERLGLEFVVVLNNDVRLGPDSLAPLVGVLRRDPRVVAVGPTVLHPDGTVWAEGGELAFAPNGLRLCGHGRRPTPIDHGPEEREFLPGACIAFRTADLVAVGGFDASYFMYWEDVDLCARLRERGGRVVWLPWVRIEHASGGSSGGPRSTLRKYHMARNAVRYLRGRGGARARLGWLVFDVLFWPLLLVGSPRSAWAKLRGTVAGMSLSKS